MTATFKVDRKPGRPEIDLTDKVVGNAMVTERAGFSPAGSRMWHCRCVCGELFILSAARLRVPGVSCSCGCLAKRGRADGYHPSSTPLRSLDELYESLPERYRVVMGCRVLASPSMSGPYTAGLLDVSRQRVDQIEQEIRVEAGRHMLDLPVQVHRPGVGSFRAMAHAKLGVIATHGRACAAFRSSSRRWLTRNHVWCSMGEHYVLRDACAPSQVVGRNNRPAASAPCNVHTREYYQRRFAAKRAAGLCVWPLCETTSANRLCVTHAEQANEYSAAYKAKMAEAADIYSMCVTCYDAPQAAPSKRCATCLLRNRDNMRERRRVAATINVMVSRNDVDTDLPTP